MTAFSRASRMIMPLAYPFFLSTFHPWTGDKMGTKGTAVGGTFLMKLLTSLAISSYLMTIILMMI